MYSAIFYLSSGCTLAVELSPSRRSSVVPSWHRRSNIRTITDGPAFDRIVVWIVFLRPEAFTNVGELILSGHQHANDTSPSEALNSRINRANSMPRLTAIQKKADTMEALRDSVESAYWTIRLPQEI